MSERNNCNTNQNYEINEENKEKTLIDKRKSSIERYFDKNGFIFHFFLKP